MARESVRRRGRKPAGPKQFNQLPWRRIDNPYAPMEVLSEEGILAITETAFRILEEIGMDFSMVEQMIITGGFGQHLDIEKAIIMGLLPDMDRSKFRYMGNSSIAGAYMALLSRDFREEALTISNAMTYVDFSSSPRFMDEFIKAQFLPHTEGRLFPSVRVDNTCKGNAA